MRSLRVDAREESGRIVEFIGQVVGKAHAKGVVLGLSGGVDSAVVGALCVRALGKARVRALMMPSPSTPPDDQEDAIKLAEAWGISAKTIEISDLVVSAQRAAGDGAGRTAKANLQARVRMLLLYYEANSSGLLVAGTGDRSEEELGFFTKWGDGGVDFLPIAHLYKTQVRELGEYLGLPKRVYSKPASPALWPGHKATDELPADYDRLDVFLHAYLDERAGLTESAKAAKLPSQVGKKIVEMRESSSHKRSMPPSLS